MPATAPIGDVLLRQNVFVQRLASGQVAKFTAFLREIDRDIRARLAGDPLTSLQRDRLEQLLTAVDDLIRQVLGRWQSQLNLELQQYAGHEAAVTARALSRSLDFESIVPPLVQVVAAYQAAPLAVKGADGGKLLASFIADWSAAERKAVTGAIRLGVFQGKTNAEIVQAIRGTQAANFADGILSVTARHAEAVARTAVQHVSNVARATTFQQNTDVVEAVQWVSTLDKRTCPACGALDGREFALNAGPRPPLHVNCRCTTVPVLGAEFRFLEQGAKRPQKGAGGPGQTAATQSYFEWLKRQPAAFQDAAIGKSRAKLLRSGGLTLERFAQLQIDKNFAPMTLEEMRRLEPLAFERAGL